ncbi:MAG: hypothetical protein FWE20_05655 [Defluviitaleaceae bacterium]|nr:hypothetical protein [Defluviitaleaceae bacterium]
MSTNDELRVNQANHYYILLEIKAQNPDKVVAGLQRAIGQAKTAMLEPDIAWVEKQITETYGKV